MKKRRTLPLYQLALLVILLAGCTPTPSPTPRITPPVTLTDTAAPPPTLPATAAPTAAPSPTPTAPSTATATTAPPPFYEPAGCQNPVGDLTPVTINGVTLSKRTHTMLQTAARLYGGTIPITDLAILQLNPPEDNLDPHGSGIVDLSPIRPRGLDVMYEDMQLLIASLRTAGFAAWLRPADAIYPGSPAHIHAVAIGDPELSDAAREQLSGEYGYFRGYSGLPPVAGTPPVDPHGGPVVCGWMVALGYADWRSAADLATAVPQWPQPGWMDRLREQANQYLAPSMAEATVIAQELDYLESGSEYPALMCGPLAAAILREADLLPLFGPGRELHNYWLANPRETPQPWSFFPGQDYDRYHFDTAVNKFDFFSFPLRPGDFLYTYAKGIGYDHMFVVTEVDDNGRAYTVTNNPYDAQNYKIERLLLYDPNDLTAGAFQNDWVSRPAVGLTGLGGFDVLRPKGISLLPGSPYAYAVRPGDTLPQLANRFDTPVAAITAQNPGVDPEQLEVGDLLTIPVNLNQPAPGFTAAPENLAGRVAEILAMAPSGSWGVYIENRTTNESVAINANEVFHPASAIKLAIGMGFFSWHDAHPEVSLTTGPAGGTSRSFEQLIEAMLVISEEEATAEIVTFLQEQGDFSFETVWQSWGAVDTTLDPRRTTPADLARLLWLLHTGEVLSPDANARMLALLRQPSRNDELRLGAGLPEWERWRLAHKPGTVFEDGWGIVADAGLVELTDSAYVIVVIANQVEWVDFETDMGIIGRISDAAYRYFSRQGG